MAEPGRKFVRFLERGVVAGIRGTKAAFRTVAEVIDEAPKAFERVGAEIETVIEESDATTDDCDQEVDEERTDAVFPECTCGIRRSMEHGHDYDCPRSDVTFRDGEVPMDEPPH